ncbi:MAG: tripartite tricarboxylate transporter substrate binding protein [Reyranella sp.]|uniref:Bug family tripartite tricarboxylate transporter substrate binding protein n=1 Tax=Reyranella sp. TaxID=1929291 RepID=UPI001ACDC0BC|nr:tripartite tricarboxylate transporter substrate binding protein [Reyranella sp.]MBN9090963.1 tripartite tricarboxylate transporter substrate binding protein [Reyranella sp.]
MKRLAFVGVLAALFAGAAQAQSFPSREIRFVNGFPAGGTSDIIGRVLAEQLTKQLGKTVVVDNKAGASGMIAAAETAKSPPDGHTILLASMAMMTVLPQMVKGNVDVDKDLVTIGNVASVYNVLVVGRDTPYKTWQDIETAAKANPEKVTCATVGSGSSQQLSCALFMALTGTKLTQVPYRGGAPAIIDMVGGRVDLMFGNMPEFMGQIRGGGLRPVAYGADAASPLLPEVPVISRTGLKDFVIHNWFGIVGPAGLSPELQKRWNEEIAKALATPEVKQKFADNGLRIVNGSKEDFDKEIAADRAKWGKVIRDFNIKPEN